MVIALSIFATSVSAQGDRRRQLAEELLILMEVKENIERSFDMVKDRQMDRIKRLNIPNAESEKVASLQEKIMSIVTGALSWEKIREDYISLYAEIFTEEELEGILAFYKSPVGKKFIEKQPELMEKSMQINQKQMEILMPKLQELTQDAIKSYQKAQDNR